MHVHYMGVETDFIGKIKALAQGLERWLNSEEHLLLSRRTWVRFSAAPWPLTIGYSNSWGSDVFSDL